ncbi:MAG: hypothetical protein LBL94_03105 [Prevotellaceae bacterium]|jgi:hypothetical protein|nr:hypothetical protein [Prevotellaceae bacterium]
MKKVILLFVAFAATLRAGAQNVVQWRFDRTGIYKETGLLKSLPADGPQLLWHYDGLGERHSSLAVSSSGKSYITGMTDGQGYIAEVQRKQLGHRQRHLG